MASGASSKRDAEAELREREQRRSDFDIKPLDGTTRERYSEEWEAVQATRSADLSVDHPDVVENYRAAHGIATAHARGNAGTEELRQAVKHYRSFFERLLSV